MALLSAPNQVALEPTHIHRSALLSSVSGVAHGVTRRVIGAGVADGNVGYSAPRDRDDAWLMRIAWMRAAGLEPESIVVGSQVHEHAIAVVRSVDAGKGARPAAGSVGRADGLATDEGGVVLLTLHADCMPIMLADPVRCAVATVHAGWRGTVANIAGEVVRTMTEAFGSNPNDLLVYLGPAIGACCYEVGDDVRDAWREQLDESDDLVLRPYGDKWTFDLDSANRRLLIAAGVPTEQIESSGICTRCSGDEWFSHRGQGPATGRYGAFIALAD